MNSFQLSDPALIEALVKTASSYPSARATPSEFVKAVAVRAFSLGLTESELRLFLKKQTGSHPGLSELLSNRSAYRRLISACRAAARSSSPAAAAENSLKTARLTLGRILSPVLAVQVFSQDGAEVEPKLIPVLTPARQIRARAALAILCVEQLKSIKGEKGWNTIMVSYPWLALRMGTSWPTAKAALNDLVDLGWIKEVGGHRPDNARRFKISGRLTREQGQNIQVQHLYDAIGSLAGLNDEPAQTAVLTRSVTHPAWTYGDDSIGFRNWLVALAHSAGIDPVHLGVQARSMSRSRKCLTLAGLDSLARPSIGDTTDVMDRLTGWARQTGSVAQAKEAKEAYKAKAAERTADLVRVREGRAKVKADLETAFGPVTSIPSPDAAPELRNAWLQGAARALAAAPVTEDRRKALKYELTRRLKLRGYGGDIATKVVDRVIGTVPALLAEEAIPASAEDPAVKQAWLRESVTVLSGRVMQPADKRAFSDEVFAKLRRRGYEKEKALKLSELLMEQVPLREAC